MNSAAAFVGNRHGISLMIIEQPTEIKLWSRAFPYLEFLVLLKSSPSAPGPKTFEANGLESGLSWLQLLLCCVTLATSFNVLRDK